MDSATEWLYEFFSKRDKNLGKDREEQVNRDIFDAGFVDSFGIIELITAIESNFKIELKQEDLSDARFKTIKGIAEIIEENISDKLKRG